MNSVSVNKIEGTFFFDPEDGIYRDHFPSSPVVPGSLVIHAFLEALQNTPIKHTELYINNFRFKKFIRPGEYSFTIDTETGYFMCRLYQNEKAIVSGEIMI